MAQVQIEKYERGPVGRVAKAGFIIFEVVMAAWCLAFLVGLYDPTGPAPVADYRNPLAFYGGLARNANAKHDFLVGLVAVWLIGSIVLYLFVRFTRRRVFVTEER